MLATIKIGSMFAPSFCFTGIYLKCTHFQIELHFFSCCNNSYFKPQMHILDSYICSLCFLSYVIYSIAMLPLLQSQLYTQFLLFNCLIFISCWSEMECLFEIKLHSLALLQFYHFQVKIVVKLSVYKLYHTILKFIFEFALPFTCICSEIKCSVFFRRNLQVAPSLSFLYVFILFYTLLLFDHVIYFTDIYGVLDHMCVFNLIHSFLALVP